MVRIWDGFADLVAGRMVDATMTRWGKFRPFFLFVPPILLGLSIATFTIPGNASSGQLIWAYVTYAALGFFYSLVNIPYGSLAAAMTQNPSERSKLATFRMAGASATQILLALVVGPQINRFRGDPEGLQSALTTLTIIFFFLGILLYFTAKEKVEREVDQPSLRESFAALKHNRPLIMLCVSSLLFLSGMFTMQTALIHYARNVLGNANLYTIMTLLSAGAIYVVGPFIPKMVRNLGKKNSYQIAGVVAAVGGVGIFLAPASQLRLVFVSFFVLGAALAAVNSLRFPSRPTRSSTANGRPRSAPKASSTWCCRSPARSARLSAAPPPATRSPSAPTTPRWPARAQATRSPNGGSPACRAGPRVPVPTRQHPRSEMRALRYRRFGARTCTPIHDG